jgi:hypothetical protein
MARGNWQPCREVSPPDRKRLGLSEQGPADPANTAEPARRASSSEPNPSKSRAAYRRARESPSAPIQV